MLWVEAILKDQSASLVVPLVTFILGGVSGFVASRFTTTKAEAQTHSQRLYENSLSHQEHREKRYIEFTNAMRAYSSNESFPTLDDFHRVATAGDLYFNELKKIADAILGNNIDRKSRETFVICIVEALEKNIPPYYLTLQQIARKIGVEYHGKFERSNYESLYRVAEKFAPNGIIPSVTDLSGN